MKIKKIVANELIQAKSNASLDDMLNAFQDKLAELKVESRTDISCTNDSSFKNDRAVIISDSDYQDKYEDVGGGFDSDDTTVSLGEIKEYWNNNSTSDPVLAEYESFDQWWKDTRDNYLVKACSTVSSTTDIQCNKQVEINDDDYSVYYSDSTGQFGEPGEVYSLGEIKIFWNNNFDNDWSCQNYDKFSDWWIDTKQYLDLVRDL